MEQRIDHRRIVLWVSIGLLVFLMPGLVRHMHRYQQMEAMLKSQERADKWVQSSTKGYTKTFQPQKLEQLAAMSPKTDAVVKNYPAPAQMLTSSTEASVQPVGGQSRAAKPSMPGPSDRSSIQRPLQPKPAGPKVVRPVMPQNESASVIQPKVMQQATLAPKTPVIAPSVQKDIPVKEPMKVDATLAEAKLLEEGLAKRVFIPKTVKPAQVAVKKPGIVLKKPLVTLQVGVFSNKKSIDRLVSKMNKWGYHAYTESVAKDKHLQRVLVQVDGKTSANHLKDKLWQKEKVHASIVR